MTDWDAWHARYDDPDSPLSRRLRLVRQHLAGWLDATPGPVRVLSLCAGDGRDLLAVLASRADADRVRAVLVELDPRNTARASTAAEVLPDVEVRTADAGDPAEWADAVPADLLLLAGIFGNVSDADVEATVRALPGLCRPGATVVWTRTRAAPDLTPAVRSWFADSGFTEVAFEAPDDVLFSVGVHRFTGETAPLPVDTGRLFTFVR